LDGQEFVVDKKITSELTNNKVLTEGFSGNIACYNFLKRRTDFAIGFPHKLYYGKVHGLGYIIAEDEIKKIVNED
jgi:hypothetical protein